MIQNVSSLWDLQTQEKSFSPWPCGTPQSSLPSPVKHPGSAAKHPWKHWLQQYPLVISAMENDHVSSLFLLIHRLKMVIFHSCDQLPEGKWTEIMNQHDEDGALDMVLYLLRWITRISWYFIIAHVFPPKTSQKMPPDR